VDLFLHELSAFTAAGDYTLDEYDRLVQYPLNLP